MTTPIIDSHCHLDRLDLDPFGGSLDTALEAARAEGVERFFNIAINRQNIPDVLAIAERHADVYASIGVHPNEGEQGPGPEVEELTALSAHSKVIAIGETGLDFFRSEGDLEWQRERFRRHIAAAKTCHKPLVVHSREARAETLAILREEGADSVGGIMHCFVEDWETAAAAMELGFYISFSGIVTFKNAAPLREVAARVPADRLLVETDSPYLAPVPYRGKSNYPGWVRHVAECVAEVRGESYENVAVQTTENFYRLFPQTQIMA